MCFYVLRIKLLLNEVQIISLMNNSLKNHTTKIILLLLYTMQNVLIMKQIW